MLHTWCEGARGTCLCSRRGSRGRRWAIQENGRATTRCAVAPSPLSAPPSRRLQGTPAPATGNMRVCVMGGLPKGFVPKPSLQGSEIEREMETDCIDENATFECL